MGSDNSTPVQQADVVHSESHQDFMEIRFDHMAFGGTMALIIIVALLIYLFRLRRKLQRIKRRINRRDQPHTVAAPSQLRAPTPQPWYPPPQCPMPQHFSPVHGQMMRLERILRQAEIAKAARRFEELPPHASGLPRRPAQTSSLLPSPNPGQRGGSTV